MPRIAPTVLERSRVQAWLEFHASTPVRFICAPAGSGKTTCAVMYARGRANRTAFVSLTPQTDEPQLIAALGRAAGLANTGSGYAALVDGLSTAAPIEIIVDSIDNATLPAREFLSRVFLDVPDGVTFLYLARSEDVVPLQSARVSGLVDVCDPKLFAFDSNDIARFGASLGLQIDAFTASSLYEATHGWAIAVGGACRAAAANELRIREALRSWRSANTLAIAEFVAEACKDLTPASVTAFTDLLAGRSIGEQEQLALFRRSGLFVTEWNGRLTLNPLLQQHGMTPDVGTNTDTAPAMVETFGRFEMTIHDEPVVWIRRRDRQIVAFLASRPAARATRSEVIAAFWPDADRQLAGQSLRSACSTIRRALAACVGRANVGKYFIGEYVLELVLENTIISSNEFSAHCTRADRAYEQGDGASAFLAYRAAELLYRSPFLAGEPPARWAIPFEEHFAALHARVESRLNELSATRSTFRSEPRPVGHGLRTG